MPLSPALKYSSLLLHFLRLPSCHFSCLPAPAKLSQKEEKKNCFNRRRRHGKYSHGTFKLSRGREMPHTCKRQKKKKKRFLSFAIFRGIKWRRRPFWFGSRREPERGGNIFLSSTLGDSFRGKKALRVCLETSSNWPFPFPPPHADIYFILPNCRRKEDGGKKTDVATPLSASIDQKRVACGKELEKREGKGDKVRFDPQKFFLLLLLLRFAAF